MVDLECCNLHVARSQHSKEIVIKGEIINKNDRTYNAASLRVVLFVKNIPLASVIILVNGIPGRSSKPFEKNVEDLEFDAIAKEISRIEVFVESVY